MTATLEAPRTMRSGALSERYDRALPFAAEHHRGAAAEGLAPVGMPVRD
jgi:hypothetical protein